MQSLILGTAQWGLDYGATNAAGRLSDEAVMAVAATARACGIRVLDTAPAYGDAEERIGELTTGFGIQTKVTAAGQPSDFTRASVAASLSRLRVEALDSVLVHDWGALDAAAKARVAQELEGLRGELLIGAVGVSAYDEGDVVSALESFGTLDVVQVPVSVLDQRLAGSAELAAVRQAGGRVQARSVLLQGAAVAVPDHPRFGGHPDVVRLREAGDPLALALAFIGASEWIDEVVVAVTTADELAQVVTALGQPAPAVDWSELASSDPWLVDPRMWTAPIRGE